MKKTILTITILLLLCSNAWPATYYASTTGSGTACTAGSKCTLKYAVETKVSDGDTVIVSGGTYNTISTLSITVDNITVEAATGETPIIDGAGVRPTGDSGYDSLLLIYSNGVTVDGITMRRSKGYAMEIMDNWPYDSGGDDATIKNCSMYQCYRMGIAMSWGAEDCLIEDCEIYENCMCKVGGYSGTQPVCTGTTMPAQVSLRGPRCIMRRCIVRDSYNEGLNVERYSEDVTVEYCEVYGNLQSQIYAANCTDPTIRYNLIYGTNTNSVGLSGRGQGLYFGNEAQFDQPSLNMNARVYGNFVANTTNNMWVSGSTGRLLNNVFMYNNTLVEAVDNAFRIEPNTGDGHIFKNNIIWQTADVIASVPSAAAVTADYNLWSRTPSANIQGVNDPTYAVPVISKTSGWTSLVGGEVTKSDFALQAGSTAIDAGIYLTEVNQANGSGTDVDVDNSTYFYGDEEITIGTDQVTLTGVTTNNLQWTGSITWVNNDDVWFRHFSGVATDIGADEYGDTPQNQPPTISASSVTPSTVANEGTLTYSVTASDPESQALSYSWKINGVQFSTTASSTYVLPAGYNDSTVQIYCQVCDPAPLCTNTSTFNIDVGTVASTTESFGENTADTYTSTLTDTVIRGGASAAINYSTETWLWAKEEAASDYDRKYLVAVDTSALSGKTVTDAYLKFRISDDWNGPANTTITMYVCSDSFVASQATWNIYSTGNSWTGTHGQGASQDTISISSSDAVGTWFTFEGATLDTHVTNNIGSTLYFLFIASPEQSGLFYFSSSEDTNGFRPALYVTYDDTAPSANTWGSDTFAVYNFESGALPTDSKGGNTLVLGAAADEDTTNYKQGSCSANFEADNSDYYYVTDVNLDTNHPLKTGDSQKIISVGAWIRPESDVTGVIWSKWKAQNDERSFIARVETELGNFSAQMVLGFNSGASTEVHNHASALSTGTWYYVAYSYQDSDKAYAIRVRNADFSVLGSDLTGTATLDANKLSIESCNVNVGAFLDAAGNPGTFFDGNIDELVTHDKFLTADDTTASASDQYPVASIQNIWAQTPDTTGTISIGDTFVISIEFDKSVTWTDVALPYAYVEVEAGGTDLRLYHSSPATGTAAIIHYFSTHATDANYVNSMIVANMISSDADLKAATGVVLNGGTFQYGSNPAIDADLTLPSSPHRLQDNAAIVIDTDSPTFHANSPYLCNSSGTQITANTEITTAGYYYIALESDDATNYLFHEGPLGNLYLTVRMLPADRLAYYYSGIGTDKLILRVYLYAGDRAITAKDTEVIVTTFTNGTTKLIDAGGNEFDYTLAHTWLIDANTLKVNISGSFAIDSRLAYQVDSDVYFTTGNHTENLIFTASNMVIQGSRYTLTGTVTFNAGADYNVINCLNISGAVTDNGTGNVVREHCPVSKEIGPKTYSPFF